MVLYMPEAPPPPPSAEEVWLENLIKPTGTPHVRVNDESVSVLTAVLEQVLTTFISRYRCVNLLDE